jgi:hypothetical protein
LLQLNFCIFTPKLKENSNSKNLPGVNVDVDGKEEEDALEVVLEDGRVQEVPAAGIVLLGS